VVVPEHPLAEEFTVNVTVTGEVVLFVSDPLMSVVPLEEIPVTETVLFLVQLYVVPDTPLLVPRTISVIALPEQIL